MYAESEQKHSVFLMLSVGIGVEKLISKHVDDTPHQPLIKLFLFMKNKNSITRKYK